MSRALLEVSKTQILQRPFQLAEQAYLPRRKYMKYKAWISGVSFSIFALLI
jgi:hypothetical protein